jgi:hypothetical protein
MTGSECTGRLRSQNEFSSKLLRGQRSKEYIKQKYLEFVTLVLLSPHVNCCAGNLI